VDLLIGSNADEWLMYMDPAQTIAEWVAANLNAEQAAQVVAQLAEAPDQLRALDRLITAYSYVCPSMRLAAAVNGNQGRAWFYYFSRQREGEQAATMGAYHGAELPYVFGTHDSWLPTTGDDRKLGEIMLSYWASFSRNGDPNGAGLPVWQPFARAASSVQVLDTIVGSVAHPSLALCDILMPQQ
jgi:para-nitrobenzyl esterase